MSRWREDFLYFSIKKAYSMLLERIPKVGWKGIVCAKYATLRVVFITWPVMQSRLYTFDRVKNGCLILMLLAYCVDLGCVRHD